MSGCLCSLKSYAVSVENSELHDHSLRINNVDPGAAFLVPVATELGGGVIIVGESSIVYAGGTKSTDTLGASSSSKTGGAQITETFTKNTFLAWGRIDDTRVLLADLHGSLQLLTVVHGDAGCVTGLELRPLGDVTFASCISYLDDGKVFVGSQVANSQIIQLLREEAGDPPSFVQVCDVSSHGLPGLPSTMKLRSGARLVPSVLLQSHQHEFLACTCCFF
jgi:DNA damage-binding protein 1